MLNFNVRPRYKSAMEVNITHDNLRRLVSPHDLEDCFLEAAQGNTAKDVETCGLLCGNSSGGNLTVTHLVLPRQTGTCNTVDMLDDPACDSFLIERGLQVLGWIHTHPTQTAFLSSVDVHTQYSYQRLLGEAVAVVCSPRYGVNKWLRLTPAGMAIVGECTFRGFHEHVSRSRLFSQAVDVVL